MCQPSLDFSNMLGHSQYLHLWNRVDAKGLATKSNVRKRMSGLLLLVSILFFKLALMGPFLLASDVIHWKQFSMIKLYWPEIDSFAKLVSLIIKIL